MGQSTSAHEVGSNADGQSQARRRALRIGILQDGLLVEERLIAGGEVQVGSEARATIVLPPQPGVPRLATLFAEKGGRFTVILGAGLEAELAFAPGAPTVTVRGEPGLPRFQEIDDEARGRIALGAVTLLFQAVRIAPAAPRPTLPPSLHDSLVNHLDWWMVGTAAASFVAHAVLMLILRTYDPIPLDVQAIPERTAALFRDQAWPLPKPIPAPPPTSVGDPASATGPRRPTRTVHAPAPAESAQQRHDRIAAAVARVIVGNDPAGHGSALRDLLQGAGSFADAERVLAGSGSVTTAPSSGLSTHDSERGGPSRVATIGDLRSVQVNDVHTGDRTDERTGGRRLPRCPGGVCTPEGPEIPEHDCDPDAVAAKMRQYRGAMVACYERLRKHDPAAAGKVRLHLTIARSGRVSSAELEPEGLDSDELSSCITDSARHWVFPELTCDKLSLSQLIVFTPSER